jgi:hypothetical protein
MAVEGKCSKEPTLEPLSVARGFTPGLRRWANAGGSSVSCREKGSEEGRGRFQLYAFAVDEFT